MSTQLFSKITERALFNKRALFNNCSTKVGPAECSPSRLTCGRESTRRETRTFLNGASYIMPMPSCRFRTQQD